MRVRIYRLAKAKPRMQSGRGGLEEWYTEPAPATPRVPESSMGLASAGDTLTELQGALEATHAPE